MLVNVIPASACGAMAGRKKRGMPLREGVGEKPKHVWMSSEFDRPQVRAKPSCAVPWPVSCTCLGGLPNAKFPLGAGRPGRKTLAQCRCL